MWEQAAHEHVCSWIFFLRYHGHGPSGARAEKTRQHSPRFKAECFPELLPPAQFAFKMDAKGVCVCVCVCVHALSCVLVCVCEKDNRSSFFL
jgi:hypothetical protein